MSIEVRIPTVFRKFTENRPVVELQPDTLKGLIEQIESRYPGFKSQVLTSEGELHRFVNVYVNDEDARYLDRLETRVEPGDKVALLPSVAGGSA